MDKVSLQSFKAGLSITKVAERLGLNPVRGRFRCIHPQNHCHGDRTPSVSLSEDKGFFRCFVCPDFHGDAIELVRLVKGCSFVEALDFLGAPKDQLRVASGSQRRPVPYRSATGSAPLPAPVFGRKNIPLVETVVPEELRLEVLRHFFRFLPKVQQHSPPANYLSKRRIFAPVWEAMKLRWIENYIATEKELLSHYQLDVLQTVGLFGVDGHLRFQRHPLILPYLDSQGRGVYFQARAIDGVTVPKEMSLKGSIPLPYNASALDGREGVVYVCEGAIDALTVVGAHRPAVGIPGSQNFKAEWVPLFANKKVLIVFDGDPAGKEGAQRVLAFLKAAEIDASVVDMPDGQDVNSWFNRMA